MRNIPEFSQLGYICFTIQHIGKQKTSVLHSLLKEKLKKTHHFSPQDSNEITYIAGQISVTRRATNDFVTMC